jgi:hypothetical protein
VALPAWICNFTTACTFFAISFQAGLATHLYADRVS